MWSIFYSNFQAQNFRFGVGGFLLLEDGYACPLWLLLLTDLCVSGAWCELCVWSVCFCFRHQSDEAFLDAFLRLKKSRSDWVVFYARRVWIRGFCFICWSLSFMEGVGNMVCFFGVCACAVGISKTLDFSRKRSPPWIVSRRDFFVFL